MAIESFIGLVAAAIGLLVLGWIAYSFFKDGISMVDAGVFAIIVLVVASVVFMLTPTAEERLAGKLKAEAGTQTAIGEIVAFNRGGGSDSETRVELMVSMQINGVLHSAKLKTQIEDALLGNFATGKPIHLLYDPNDLSRVAIDRRASPTVVE